MNNQFKRVSVVGLGYIGLPTAAVIASRGVEVIGVEINQAIVDKLNRGQIHIVEPELDVLVHGAVASGKFRATITPEPADAFLIAVPTPFKGDHAADLSYIESAARNIASVLKNGDLVILESTSPVGATEQMEKWLSAARPDLSFPYQSGENSDIRIAYCPERVLPGRVIHELVANDRIIGGLTPKCTALASAFYRIFVQGKCLATKARSAEMAKLTENAFRDVNIAFANELSLICDRLDIDVWELIELANHHPRVKILQPGPGVGGHCIAVDPWFIVESAPDLARMIHTARLVNDGKPRWVIDRIKSAASRSSSPKIACLGLAFKPDIDDLRESPSLEIVAHLAHEIDGKIFAVEPYVDALPAALGKYRNVEFRDAESAIRDADVVVVLVNHQMFAQIDRKLLEGKSVIDTRGMWR
ncbi:UDP-N-acetyl-D-mannosamine dehydrogenase VpsB [soil metagenome]